MVETALTARASLRAAAVPDLRPLLEKVPRAERGKLINQSSLGLGSPRARIVIVGQEHAYDLDDIEKLAVEGCGLTALWLCGGAKDVTAKISGLSGRRRFTLHPGDYYPDPDSGHTWRCVCSALGVGGYDFGDRAHLIEISAHPATNQTRGRRPSSRRLAFLQEFMRRTDAGTVLFHGTRWRKEQKLLGAAYLGVSRMATHDAAVVPSKSGKTKFRIKRQQVGDTQVLLCKMLNGSARPSADFLATLGGLLPRS